VTHLAKAKGYCKDIVDAWSDVKSDGSKLEQAINNNSRTILADENMGLCKQLLDGHKRWTIKELTNTYLSLPLPDLARRIGPSVSNEQVIQLLMQMVEAGEVIASIDVINNVVFFDEAGLIFLDFILSYCACGLKVATSKYT